MEQLNNMHMVLYQMKNQKLQLGILKKVLNMHVSIHIWYKWF